VASKTIIFIYYHTTIISMPRTTTSIKVDEDLWAKFKAKCAIKKVDMSDFLEELIDEALKRK